MTDHLSGVRAKLQRAYKHFSELDKVRQRWVNTDAGEIVHENHPEAREYLVICKRAPVPPPEMSVIVGEIVHGLRSSLDNLIYALAIRESKQGPPPFWKRLEFPIYKDEADFNNQWQKRLSIFSQGARTLIKDLQPFNEHPLDLSRNGLWILRELGIIDKHRRLNVVGQQIRHIAVDANRPLTVTHIHAGSLVDNAVLMRYATDGSPDVQVQTDFAFEVAFHETDVLPQYPLVLPVLRELRSATEAIVANFEQRFF